MVSYGLSRPYARRSPDRLHAALLNEPVSPLCSSPLCPPDRPPSAAAVLAGRVVRSWHRLVDLNQSTPGQASSTQCPHGRGLYFNEV